MGMRTRQNATDSPKAEVGEIDTRAPFESVKAAVSLFGEVAFSTDKLAAKKAKTPPTEVIDSTWRTVKLILSFHFFADNQYF